MKRLHVYFKGNVQGVGFRFTARHIASRLGVKGWVRNLPSGEVECVLEADEPVLKEFLSQIKDDMSGYIRGTDESWSDRAGEFRDFRIKF